jgi:DNA-binding NtrC family response regulator
MSHALIVDDDANTRQSLAGLVASEGFTTAQAGGIAEARVQLVRQRPDVMLVDLCLPDGEGMSLIDDLEDRASTEVVLITGHASIDTAVQALRLGASDYLVKPVDVPRLKSILQRVPGNGEPSCSTLAVPALAAALACVSEVHVWPGASCAAVDAGCAHAAVVQSSAATAVPK